MKIIYKKILYAMVLLNLVFSTSGCTRDRVSLSTSDEGGDTTYTEDLTEITDSSKNTEEDNSPTDLKKTGQDKVTVFVCGAVVFPDVYELPDTAIVKDALEAAGGFAENADKNSLNLADKVEQGQKIYFPEEGEKMEDTTDSSVDDYSEPSSMDEKIDINSATEEELQSLSGIGEMKAKAIAAYRKENGKFQNIDDIKNVNGIGDALFEKIKDYICAIT